MKRIIITAIAGATVLMSGCASIVGGTQQTLSVDAHSGADTVTGATCELKNDKGTWFLTTPGTVTVHRSADALNVTCKKDGLEPATSTVKSSVKGSAFGNILFGGIIGAAIDTANGSAFDYPDLITMLFGKSDSEKAGIKQDVKADVKSEAKPATATN
ncbi:MAG TPA: hypothetical protein VJU59_37625 [Paraburkholderia sp.]|jgi:hypothetical protein|uniref:hypothetical protein n=1 Tax=Paraburkholderia sp. TaxID=1926495 RepID=UPI002B466DBC|nr:hypothetical protein [Paraburkholderia sp.]HKR45331.1 hypothetical protein [Paraburkholderia sp.]